MIDEYKPGKSLRSEGVGQLVVTSAETKHSETAFSHYSAPCWNQLPCSVRSAPTVAIFKKNLKIALFSFAFA